MPTLYVENIPEDLYEALRAQARSQHRSIAAEVLALLEASVPTESELQSRVQFMRSFERLRGGKANRKRKYPSTEQMQREDRAR